MKIKKILSIVAILFFININAYSQSVVDFVIGEEGYTLYCYVTSVEPNEVEIYNDNFEGENLIIPNVVTYEGVDYNVTSIGDDAFSTVNIVSLVIPENIRQIGASAFKGCTKLKDLTINTTQITTIPGYCFYKCPISSISLPNNITTIGDYAFSETNLTEITLPNSVTSIGDYAFANCTELKSISLQNNITEIGKYAFSNTKLSVIVLPNSVTSIDEQAFSNNTNLIEIILSNSIESIGASTFYKCKSLVTIRCNSTTPPKLGTNALGNITGSPANKINANLRIYVPATSTIDYINAEDWSSYNDRIVGAPTFVTDGYWNEASNWRPEGVPSNEENVYINAAATILSSDIITVNSFGICDNGSITIKEGGQLIHQSGSGTVTIEKSIKAYEIGYDNYLESGWYTISSPFSNFIIPNSMTSGNYELYRYDETEYEWENHKNTENDFNTLESGRGYIYASDEDKELTISGELNTKDKTYHLTAEGELLTGFHLVGNPFMHNITKGVNGNLYNADLATGYYTLTNNGGWVAKSDDEPIAPTQGLLIKTSTGGTLTINKNAVGRNTRSASNESIAFNVRNTKYRDVAHVTFNNGISLDKIKHRNSKIPMIYIPVNNTKYAIAVMNNDTNEFPVAFEAMTMGEYTISISANKNRYSEITLVDIKENRTIDLLKEEYTFFATTNEDPERFIVKISPRNDAVIYANSNNITIDNIKGNGYIQVYDITGKVVTSLNSQSAIYQISAESMTNGVYIVRLIDDNGTKVQKIMLNH